MRTNLKWSHLPIIITTAASIFFLYKWQESDKEVHKLKVQNLEREADSVRSALDDTREGIKIIRDTIIEVITITKEIDEELQENLREVDGTYYTIDELERFKSIYEKRADSVRESRRKGTKR